MLFGFEAIVPRDVREACLRHRTRNTIGIVFKILFFARAKKLAFKG
jgi:hypothetical protein